MPTQNESSVTFSLEELMAIEKQRLLDEETARREQEEAKARALVEKEEKERIAAAERIAAEDFRRRRDLVDQKLTAAQIEGATIAVVETAKMQAQARLRAEELKLQQEHALELERIRSNVRKGTSPKVIVIAATVMLAIAGVGGFFGIARPRQQASGLVQQARDLAAQCDEADWLLGLQKVAQAEALYPTCEGLAGVRATLQTKLQGARDERDRAYAEKIKILNQTITQMQMAASAPSTEPAKPPPSTGTPVRPPVVRPTQVNTPPVVTHPCPPGIPLAGCN